MYKQVYLHPIRRAYDIHLKDFLIEWLDGGKFPTQLNKHLNISDVEVLTAIRADHDDHQSPRHALARRLQCREHFRRFYEATPSDTEGGTLIPGKVLAQAAEAKFGQHHIRYDHIPPKAAAPIFPVMMFDGKIESSLRCSQLLAHMPEIGVDTVYCDKSILAEAIKWRDDNKNSVLRLENRS